MDNASNTYNGHSFWIANDGTKVELLETLQKEVLIEMTMPDNTVEMRSINRVYFEEAIRKGTLKPQKIENWLIKRTLDDKYYQGKNIWTEDWTAAMVFKSDKVDLCVQAFEKHNYPVVKIVY